MATILSFPVRRQQQQQPPSTTFIGADNFYAHFGLRPGINRMFTWSNKLRKIYAMMLFSCVQFPFWLPIINGNPNDVTELILSGSNNSLTKSQLRDWAFVRRCTLSSSITIDNLSSYTSMQILVVLLCLCSLASVIWSQGLCIYFCNDQVINPYRWFSWCRKLFIYLVISSICNQLGSVLGCRPIETLYDIRYTSMIIVQIIGFFICLLFAFFLGVKYASVKRGN